MFLRVSKNNSAKAVKPVANDAGFTASETVEKQAKRVEQAAADGITKASPYTELSSIRFAKIPIS